MITKKTPHYIFIVLLSFYLVCLTNFASGIKVYDFASLLTLDEIETLQEKATSLADTYQMDIGIVTTEDTKGASAMTYADNFYDENGFGYGIDKDGLLFLIDMDHRELYISTCGKGITYFTDLRISQMLDSIYYFASDGDYYGAATDFLDQVTLYLEAGIPSNQHTVERPFSDPREDYHDPYMQEALPSHKPFTNRLGQPLTAKSISLSIIIALLGAFILAFIARAIVCYMYKHPYRTTPQTKPNDLSVRYTKREDRFVTSHTSKVKVQRNPPPGGPSGASGRSSMHHSSGGHSHGGGGRKF